MYLFCDFTFLHFFATFLMKYTEHYLILLSPVHAGSRLVSCAVSPSPILQPSSLKQHIFFLLDFFKPISLFRSINTHKQHSTSLQQAGHPDNIILCTKMKRQIKTM